MKRRTPIHRAISEVLKTAERALTPEEIYAAIRERGLYEFKARNPIHVVASDLRRHCIDLNFPSARSMKFFKQENGGDGIRYRLLEKPERVEPNVYEVKRPGKRGGRTIVTIPPEESVPADDHLEEANHTEIQWRLLELGQNLGYSTWAPMQDRQKVWNGHRIGDARKLLGALPRQFDKGTMKIISYIDVIWVQKQAIMAAFEVEHTSQIYSGLLRMSDLMCRQPNLNIRWYLVAPGRRFAKFANEVARPTFCELPTPLFKTCRFLPYDKLIERLNVAREFITHLKAEFLNDISEQYDPQEAFED